MSSGDLSAEHLNGKQKREVALEEHQRHSVVAAAVKAAWQALIHDMKPPLFPTWLIRKGTIRRKSPWWPCTVINISSNGGNCSSGSGDNTRMTMLVGWTITAVSMMSGTGERLPWVV